MKNLVLKQVIKACFCEAAEAAEAVAAVDDASFLRRNAIKVEFGDNQPQGGQRGVGWHLFRSISNPCPATKNVTAHPILRGN